MPGSMTTAAKRLSGILGTTHTYYFQGTVLKTPGGQKGLQICFAVWLQAPVYTHQVLNTGQQILETVHKAK